ncbi:glycine-rich RNA-binding protein 3, mitochondrial-like [Helianthus annuus]|uniref:glycine-rich RNA-binding protein 3, mitochondrial-like n=1 Tax=Helianthus annuus TaxID=4232 RepID=UPI000B8F5D23|nr:glycine-rich RNA-binding protein 3, mitochondrial-like [Helianthus annuus]
MALFKRGGNILRQTVTNNEFMSLVAMIRCASNWKLFVGGLGPEINSTLLREAFSVNGEVIEAKAVMDRKSGRCRGYGFVEFANYHSLDFTRNHGSELYGRTVTVRWAKDSRDEYTLEDAIADGCGDISNWKEDEDKDEDEDEDEDGS